MVAAILLVLLFVDTFATGYLVAVFGRLRRHVRDLTETVAALDNDVANIQQLLED